MDDVDWVKSVLSGPEYALFDKMTINDQAHGVSVARDVASQLELSPRSWIVAAALLHDVGKIESGVGVAGRVLATLMEPLIPERFVPRATRLPGWFGRVGEYLRYTEAGAVLLASVGSDPRVRAWAREHHMPPTRWTIPADVGRVLQAADDRAS
ncbi:MAG: hypothetical protein GY708_13365 [Actinomycetia bacterium]|nr:hypothetical protein [Actinomycetes bacterium]MCP4963090.1 hypothetical protein [Actinomycetes bacterium]